MAYKNFIPTIWSEAINRELERARVFVADTNRQYEGDVRKMGDTVRILGVGKPTITTQTGTEVTLTGAENIADSATSLLINKVSYFNYKVDDIDKRQAVGGIMEALSKEASEGLAQAMDCAVADLALADEAVLDGAGTTITANNVIETIDAGLEKLYENDVKPDGNITLTVPPWFYTILKEKYITLDTDNSNMLANGKVGRYGNVLIRMSNNVPKDGSDYYYLQLKTNKAIAFANPMTHVEAYRPELGFSDAVKGFVLYGTKIVRPKEMIVLKVKK